MTRRPANLSDNQTPNQTTGHSVSRLDFQTQHALAQSLGHLRLPTTVTVGRRILMYYLSRSPCLTTFHPGDVKPSLRSGFFPNPRVMLRRLHFSSPPPLRDVRRPFAPAVFLSSFFQVFGGDGRKTGGKTWATDKVSRPLTGKYLTGQGDFNFGRLSLSFGSFQSLRSFTRST